MAQTRADSGAVHSLPFTVMLSLGHGMPSRDRRCLVESYLLPAVEVQSRGRFFVSAAAEGIIPSGSRLLCLIGPDVDPLPAGEVLLRADDRFDFSDAGGHFSLGFGVNVPMAASEAASICWEEVKPCRTNCSSRRRKGRSCSQPCGRYAAGCPR